MLLVLSQAPCTLSFFSSVRATGAVIINKCPVSLWRRFKGDVLRTGELSVLQEHSVSQCTCSHPTAVVASNASGSEYSSSGRRCDGGLRLLWQHLLRGSLGKHGENLSTFHPCVLHTCEVGGISPSMTQGGCGSHETENKATMVPKN